MVNSSINNSGSIELHESTANFDSIEISYSLWSAFNIYDKSNLTITNSSFYSNLDLYTGGAIYFTASSLVLNDSYFYNNTANFGGSIGIENMDQVSINRC